jgi:hypothetical protein
VTGWRWLSYRQARGYLSSSRPRLVAHLCRIALFLALVVAAVRTFWPYLFVLVFWAEEYLLACWRSAQGRYVPLPRRPPPTASTPLPPRGPGAQER